MPIRTLHLCSSYTQTDLYAQLIDRLTRDGIRNTVFVPVGSEVAKQYPSDVLVEKCFCKWDSFFYSWKQHKILKRLLSRVDVKQFDLIHAHYLFTNGNIALKLHKLYNIPYIVAVRNTDINLFFKYRINLRRKGVQILSQAKKVIVLSPAYVDQVLKYVPEKDRETIRRKILVIPNGVNDFWFQHLFFEKRDLSELHVAFAGTIDRNKNLLTSVKALDLLEKENYKIQYHVAGKIVDKKVFKRISEKKYTKYYGKLNKETLINLYKKCNLFLMPSFHETFGLVYAEALTQGLPVIYSANQGFDNQFENGTVGYAVDPANAQDIKDKILMIIGHYDKIMQNIPEKIGKFQWDRISKIYYDLYRECTGE